MEVEGKPLSKSIVESAVRDGRYSLHKRSISKEKFESGVRSPIWLYVSQIYNIPKGQPLPKRARPIKGWVAGPDGVILSKTSATSNLLNYLGKCDSIPLAARKK